MLRHATSAQYDVDQRVTDAAVSVFKGVIVSNCACTSAACTMGGTAGLGVRCGFSREDQNYRTSA